VDVDIAGKMVEYILKVAEKPRRDA
jgi:hypothetical protein